MSVAKDTVKENLLKDNADPFEIENFWLKLDQRKKMAVWMNGYFKDVINKVCDKEVKEHMIMKLNEYEKKNKIQVNIIKEIQSTQQFQDAFKQDKKVYSDWVKSQKDLKEFRYILFKLYDYGSLENILEFELRRSLFKMIFGRK